MALAFLNIRGLQSHIDELRSFVMDNGVQSMAINETKLSKHGGCQLLYAEFRKNRYRSWEIFLFSGTRENE